MKLFRERVPLLLLEKPENVFDLHPSPAAVLVDLEGTLTEFSPPPSSVIEALSQFDEAATQNGLPLSKIHYVTNANLGEIKDSCPALSGRFHPAAHKPFFTPPHEFQLRGHRTVVVGDQYLTDGLLAWRFGFSFALVRTNGHEPAWPRLQLFIGRKLAHVFFRSAEKS